jgi:thermitase
LTTTLRYDYAEEVKKSPLRKVSQRTKGRKKSVLPQVIGICVLILGTILTIFILRNFPNLRLFAKQDDIVHKSYRDHPEDLPTGRIIVKLAPGAEIESSKRGQSVLERLSKKNKKQLARIILRLEKLNSYVLEVAPEDMNTTINDLISDPDVRYAEPDQIAHGTDVNLPDDTYFSRLYGLHNTGQLIANVDGVDVYGLPDADIDVPEAWTVTTGTRQNSSPIVVAVLDSGIDQDHPELAGKIIGNQNFVSGLPGSDSVDDRFGHGTHVAGTIAALKDNGVGIAGVCPGCVLLNGKVLSDTDQSYYSWIADGIRWAVDNGANVINISVAGTVPSQTLTDAINYAWDRNVIVVAAAMNNNSPEQAYPAAIEPVIAVAATDSHDVKSYFSNYGASWVDIAAPGSNILSTLPNAPVVSPLGENYGFLDGTSQAAPYVSGVAALLWATPYGTSAQAVRGRLLQTADQISGTGTYWANGRVNAGVAVNATVVNGSPTPTQAVPTETTGSPTSIPAGEAGVSAQYFSNTNFTGTSEKRVDQSINFAWGKHAAIKSIGKDSFSVRWTGYVTPQYSEIYTFYTKTSDGVRLWVNNTLLINNWVTQGTKEKSGTIVLTAGQKYPITMEYFDNKGSAVAQLRWSSPSQVKQIVPVDRLSH